MSQLLSLFGFCSDVSDRYSDVLVTVTCFSCQHYKISRFPSSCIPTGLSAWGIWSHSCREASLCSSWVQDLIWQTYNDRLTDKNWRKSDLHIHYLKETTNPYEDDLTSSQKYFSNNGNNRSRSEQREMKPKGFKDAVCKNRAPHVTRVIASCCYLSLLLAHSLS